MRKLRVLFGPRAHYANGALEDKVRSLEQQLATAQAELKLARSQLQDTQQQHQPPPLTARGSVQRLEEIAKTDKDLETYVRSQVPPRLTSPNRAARCGMQD